MNVTIEQLEAKHSELADLIAKFRAQPAPSRVLGFTAEISLADGEHYAGLALKIDGTPSHHLILLPGEGEDLQWSAAVEWAEKAGGALPTRQEQALLYANLKDQFKPEWYWSGEEEDGSYAWFQTFTSGSQYLTHKNYELRARAVRRDNLSKVGVFVRRLGRLELPLRCLRQKVVGGRDRFMKGKQ